MESKKYAVIVAGGSGQRMQSAVPKQFLLLAGLPVLMHTINRFVAYDTAVSIFVVLPDAQISYWKTLCTEYNFTVPHKIVPGGATRFHSVKNALEEIHEECIIAVHDGVRPLVPVAVIQQAFATAQEKGSAIPSIVLNESIRKVEHGKNKALDRDKYRLIQTPQCFTSAVLNKAYLRDFQETFTDDASVVEFSGTPVFLINGDKANIKITTSDDLIIAEALLRNNI